MPATLGRGGVSAAGSAPGEYLAGTPPAPPLGGRGAVPQLFSGPRGGGPPAGLPDLVGAGRKAGASAGTYFRGPECGLQGCLVSVWGERTVAGPKNLRTVAGGGRETRRSDPKSRPYPPSGGGVTVGTSGSDRSWPGTLSFGVPPSHPPPPLDVRG